MTLAKARQLLEVQAGFGGGYNRNGARTYRRDRRVRGPRTAP
jgi:hypothetical protein